MFLCVRSTLCMRAAWFWTEFRTTKARLAPGEKGIDFVRQSQEFIGLQVKFFDLSQIHDLGEVWPKRWIQPQPFRVSLNVAHRQLLSELHCDQPPLSVDDILGRPAQRMHTPTAAKIASTSNIFVKQRAPPPNLVR